MAELAIKNELLKGVSTDLFTEEGIMTAQGRNLIERVELTLAAVKDAEKEIRNKCLTEMKAKGILKVKDETLSITFKDAYDKETVDTKRLKEEQPDIYDEYCKVSPVKESLLIKVGK